MHRKYGYRRTHYEREAAKNYEKVTTTVDPDDYNKIVEIIKKTD